jgi:predicted permease
MITETGRVGLKSRYFCMIVNTMPNIIEIVLPTFIVIFIGYLLGKLTKIDVAPVVDISLYVAVPALVIVSLAGAKIVLFDAAKVWAAALIITFGCLLVAWLVFKILRQKHSGLYVSIAIMNTANIPFPVIYLAYGAEGLAAATLFFIPNLLLIYTLGIYVMAGRHWKDNIKEVFRLPLVYAFALGLTFNFLDIRLPELVFNALDFIAMMAIPLFLLVLGHNLSRVRMTSLPTTLLASFLRVGVGLGIGLLVVYALSITGIFRSVVILDSAMPAAVASSILATKYKNEAELVSSVVFVTTLASLAVIPFLLHMLG